MNRFTLFLVALCSLVIFGNAVADTGTDLGSLLQTVGTLKTVPIQYSLGFFGAALLGLGVHFLIDVKKGIITGGFAGLVNYLFVSYPLKTIAVIGVILAGESAWFAINPEPSWLPLLIAALPIGYTADSMFNQGATPA